jgi:hypothetical protein
VVLDFQRAGGEDLEVFDAGLVEADEARRQRAGGGARLDLEEPLPDATGDSPRSSGGTRSGAIREGSREEGLAGAREADEEWIDALVEEGEVMEREVT